MDLHDIEGEIDCDGLLKKIDVMAESDIGTHFLVTGTFEQKERPVEDKPQTVPWIQQVHRLHRSLYSTPHWMVTVRERVNEMVFEQTPEVTIKFHTDSTNPKSATGSMAFSSGPIQYRGVSYDQLYVDVEFAGNKFVIPRAQLKHGDNAFNLTGTYTRSNDLFEAHAQNNLPMNALSVFFPDTWQNKMTRAGLQFTGSLESEAWVGPCGLRGAPENWSGWLSIDDASANDLQILHAFASVKREPNTLSITDARIEGTEGSSAGTITFDTKTDIQRKVTEGGANLGIDLKPLKPFLPGGLKRFANQFDIRDRPARFEGTFKYPHTNKYAATIRGIAYGTNVSYRGVFLSGFETAVRYENRILHLESFHANCQTGAVDGQFVLDLPNKIYGIDLDITADPGRIGPAAGSNVARRLKPYTFSDDVLLQLEGIVYPRAMENTELHVYLSGSSIGRTNIKVDHVQASGHVFDNKLIVSNLVAKVFDGTVTGVLKVVRSKLSPNFQFSGAVTNLVVDRIVKTLRPTSTNQYEGYLDGRVHLAGPYPDKPHRKNITGSGAYQVRDGRLMRVSIFGGLSFLLSKIYPGLGFAEQNQLKGTFVIKDGDFRTKDTKLLGSVLSFSAKGKYSFSDNLDFDIQVKPLRAGIIAGTIRIVTTPLTKLLEFNVSGPLKNPKWQAANIPLL